MTMKLSDYITDDNACLITKNTIDPTSTDDEYKVGDMWINTVDDTVFICANNTTNAAAWNVTTIATSTSYKMDDISSSFNGVTSVFTITVDGGLSKPLGKDENVNIHINNIPQEPGLAYSVNGDLLTFTTAPTSGDIFWGVLVADVADNSTQGVFYNIDDISSGFDGVTTAFTVTVNTGESRNLGSRSENVTLYVSNVAQDPQSFIINDDLITFDTAPASDDTFWGVVLGNVYNSNDYYLQTEVNDLYTVENECINGNFDIWQRGVTSGTLGTSSWYEFTADRFKNWFVFPTSGCSVNRSEFATGQTDVPDNPRYYQTVTITGGQTEGFIRTDYNIKDGLRYSGKKVQSGFWVKGIAGKSIRFVGLLRFTSSDVSALSGDVLYVLPDNGWNYVSTMFEFPVLGSVDTSTTNKFQLNIVYADDSLGFYSTTEDISIAEVDVYTSDVELPVRRRTFEEELQLCLPYYEILDEDFWTTNYGSGAATTFTYTYQSIKVSLPTITTGTLVNLSSCYVRSGYTNRACGVTMIQSGASTGYCRSLTIESEL